MVQRGRTRLQHEQQQRREKRAASRWLAKHGIGALPGRRYTNGESSTRERSTMLSGADKARTGTKGSSYPTTSIDQFDTVADWEESANDTTYTPLVGRRQDLSPVELDRRKRIEHVLTFLLPMHVDLLLMRHFQEMTLEGMAEEMSCSHVNVMKRLRVAEQDFRRAYAAHYEDDLEAA